MAYQAMQQVYRSTYGIHVKRGIFATLIAQKNPQEIHFYHFYHFQPASKMELPLFCLLYASELRRGLSGFDIYFRSQKGYFTIS